MLNEKEVEYNLQVSNNIKSMGSDEPNNKAAFENKGDNQRKEEVKENLLVLWKIRTSDWVMGKPNFVTKIM